MARPKKIINWKEVNKLLEADCEGTEIAAYLGIHSDTLYLRCQEENKMGFSEYLQEKKSRGNSLLKEQQFKQALKGDKTMLVWLGKQRLGQKEKHELEGNIHLSPFLDLMKQSTEEKEPESDK